MLELCRRSSFWLLGFIWLLGADDVGSGWAIWSYDKGDSGRQIIDSQGNERGHLDRLVELMGSSAGDPAPGHRSPTAGAHRPDPARRLIHLPAPGFFGRPEGKPQVETVPLGNGSLSPTVGAADVTLNSRRAHQTPASVVQRTRKKYY